MIKGWEWRTGERTWEEVEESVRYGSLYYVLSVCANKILCQRILGKGGRIARDRKGNFLMGTERVTLEKTPGSTLPAAVGDLCFIDNGPDPSWALWKVQKR